MSENKPDLKAVAPSLKSAMRSARLEDAERSDVIAELRGAELARLEMLAEMLEPLYAQIPGDTDLFDAGVYLGERPRLFVDMIGFIEMAPDKRVYRFFQDTRHGRVRIAESERAETMVEAVTDYVARRLLERERALASDLTVEDAARALLARPPPAGDNIPATDARPAATAPGPSPDRRRLGWLWDGIEFVALFIGYVILLIALAGAVYLGWTMFGEAWWQDFFGAAGPQTAPPAELAPAPQAAPEPAPEPMPEVLPPAQ